MIVNWHLHFLLKCHLNVVCLVVHVISISNVSIYMWVFSFTSHTTYQSLYCACQLILSLFSFFFHLQVFACQMSKTCRNFVKIHIDSYSDLFPSSKVLYFGLLTRAYTLDSIFIIECPWRNVLYLFVFRNLIALDPGGSHLLK